MSDSKMDHLPEDGATHTDDPSVFVGSKALMDALYQTYSEHIGMAETEGPDGPYMWCSCGWRSDYLGDEPIGRNQNPGNAYAVHLTNAQHAAAVTALQPIVRRVASGAWCGCKDPQPYIGSDGSRYCEMCDRPMQGGLFG